MKTSTIHTSKLSLHKETIRALSAQDLKLVAGGSNGCLGRPAV